ncbi:MAG: hypothetical protein R3D69_14515 [Xanthobacteraceae bacterium]
MVEADGDDPLLTARRSGTADDEHSDRARGGCASALMFASIISGALISLLLFYLAPLPLMVAALGWGPASALIGGIVAGAGLGFAFGLLFRRFRSHRGPAGFGLATSPARQACRQPESDCRE